MIKLLPIGAHFKYMRGHLDEHIPRSLLNPIQLLNCDADKLAKKALRKAILQNKFINCMFPHDTVTIEIGGQRISALQPTQFMLTLGARQPAPTTHDATK